MKEVRKTNILFNKNGQGASTTRVTLPVPFVRKLGFTENDREAYISLEDDKIIIEKRKKIMKRSLEEIIEEIKNLDENMIFDLQNRNHGFKREDFSEKEIEYYLSEIRNDKKNAINSITERYEKLDESNISTDRDYIIAEFKTFEYYFEIIKDEKEKILIDEELHKKAKKFFDGYSKAIANI